MAKKGEKQPEHVKRKIAESLRGRKRPASVVKKMSESLKGNIPWNKGKKGVYSKSTLKKISEGGKGRIPWNKGLTKETNKSLKAASDKLTGRKGLAPNYILAQKAKSDPRVKTYIENLFGQGLEEQGIKAQYNFKVGRWWVDYAVPSLKIAFECDGEYWHQNKARDKERDLRIEKLGWQIYRFTGSDIVMKFEVCMEKVQRILEL